MGFHPDRQDACPTTFTIPLFITPIPYPTRTRSLPPWKGARYFPRCMKFHLLLSFACVVAIAACDSPSKKTPKKPSPTPAAVVAKVEPVETDDSALQSFITRLRAAVIAKDLPTLAAMMPSDFGYRWDNPPQGESVFDFWDTNNLWPQLTTIVNSNWTPHEGFMVAPPQLVRDPNYNGFRAGVAMKDGGWKFAYFVPPPAE